MYRLMQNTRFAIDHIWVLNKPFSGEHDVTLGPILRNSGVPGRNRNRFLRARGRYQSEKHYTQYCNSAVRMLWLHSYLRYDRACCYCSRFFIHRIITDFRPIHPPAAQISGLGLAPGSLFPTPKLRRFWAQPSARESPQLWQFVVSVSGGFPIPDAMWNNEEAPMRGRPSP